MKFYTLSPTQDLWSEKLNAFSKEQKDIFYYQKFAELCQKTIYKKYDVYCLVAEENQDIIICPVVKRKFKFENKYFFDLTSLYNLSGPIQNSTNLNLQKFFSEKLHEHCLKNKIKNYFIRFHPIIKNDNILIKSNKVINTGDFLSVNLRKIDTEIMKDFSKAHKKSINKAKKSNIEIIISNKDELIKKFIKIYYEEMKLKNAESFYFFEKNFFSLLDKYIPNNFQFFFAIYEGELISAEMVLYNEFYCHSFLGSTLYKYRKQCSNHLIKHKIIEYFANKDLKYYLLGGGVNTNDGIFKYKTGFTNEMPRENTIGKLNFDEEFHNNLINNFKSAYPKENFIKMQFYEKYL